MDLIEESDGEEVSEDEKIGMNDTSLDERRLGSVKYGLRKIAAHERPP